MSLYTDIASIASIFIMAIVSGTAIILLAKTLIKEGAESK